MRQPRDGLTVLEPLHTGVISGLTGADVVDLVSAVETAYEGAWYLSDAGRIDFGPFEGLPRSVQLLRRLRDQLRSAT
jgi:hypothetical protein